MKSVIFVLLALTSFAEARESFLVSPLRQAVLSEGDIQDGLKYLYQHSQCSSYEHCYQANTSAEIQRQFKDFRSKIIPGNYPFSIEKEYHLFSPHVFSVSFRSPYAKGEHRNSDTVKIEYFITGAALKKSRSVPVLVLVPHSTDNMKGMRSLARVLATWGSDIAVAVVDFPHYGNRRNDSVAREAEGEMNLEFVSGGAEAFQRNFFQSAADLHFVKDWIASRPEVDQNRISLAGFSLGGVVVAFSAGLNPGHYTGNTIIVVAGGQLDRMINNYLKYYSKEQAVQEFLSWGLSERERRSKLAVIDPLTYIGRSKNENFRFILSTDDELMDNQASYLSLTEGLSRENNVKVRRMKTKHNPSEESLLFQFRNILLPMMTFARP